MKFIKISLYILASVVVLAIVFIGIFLATFDADEYRTQISEQVKQRTGRDLTLGHIKPSIFPWLGIELNQLVLSNASGFKAEQMVKIETLDARVELLPLLKQQIKVDTLRVYGLQLFLEKNNKAVTNWDDILEKLADGKTPAATAGGAPGEISAAEDSSTASPPASSPPDSLPLGALLVNGIDIKDASINWDDVSTKQNIDIQKFNLSTGEFSQGKAMPVKFSLSVELAEPQARFDISSETSVEFNPDTQQLKLDALTLSIEAALQQADIKKAKLLLKTQLDANLKQQQFDISELNLTVNVSGDAIPGGELKAVIKSAAQIDLLKQTANVQKLTVDAMDLTIQTQLAVTELLDAPKAQGKFKLLSFNPAKLAQSLAIELPEMSNKNALQSAEVSFDFSGSEQAVALKPLLIKLDQSAITGDLAVSQFAAPAITFQLVLDKLNLDDYLPPVVEAPATPVAANVPAVAVDAGSDTPIDLPLPLLRSLNVNGSFTAKTLQAFAETITELVIKINARDGLINIPVIKAQLLGGQLVSSAQLDARKDIPLYQFKLDGKGLKADTIVSPVLQHMLGEDSVSLEGASDVSADLQTKGQSVKQLMANSNGRFTFDLGKSTLHGVDAEYFVRKAVASYMEEKKQKVPDGWRGEYKPSDTTALKLAHMSALIQNGVVKNQDLLLDSSRFKVTGAGQANLVTEKIDYRAVVDLNPAQVKTTIEKVLDTPMPVFVKGSFAQPEIIIDKSTWLKNVSKELTADVKAELKESIKAQEEKSTEAIKESVDKKVDKVKDKYKDKLKGLFN